METSETLRTGAAVVTVLPHRGALVSRVVVDGVDVLYLDESTLDAPGGAVRGGIPLLFPFAGELADGRLLTTGTTMPRHGFARTTAWEVMSASVDRLLMRLPFSTAMREQYPFDCEVAYEVAAIARGVRVELRVHNRDRRVLPLAPGWHPYFPCPVDQKRTCLRQLLRDTDLAADPIACDVNVPAASDRRTEFVLPDAGVVLISASEDVRTLEVWTPPEKPFVCVEPWCGPSNVINTADRVVVGPGETGVFWMAIELVDRQIDSNRSKNER